MGRRRANRVPDRVEALDAAFDVLLSELGHSLEDRPDLGAYADDPCGFAADILYVDLTGEQQAILQSLVDNRETNVQAAHGVGKTFVAAIAVLWWVFCRKGLVITTAPTKRQVNELLWSEVRKKYDAYHDILGGERTTTTVKLSEEARAYGFTASDTNVHGFAGVHASNLLAIQDEASGISEAIDDGFESCVTGSGNRALRIGNPITEGTPFHRACLRSTATLRIPVFGHPNVSWAYERCDDGEWRLKPDVAARIPRDANGYVSDQDEWPEDLPRDLIPGAVSVGWIEKKRIDKGETSSYWRSRVMAEFPESSINALVPRKWFREARARYDADPEHWQEVASKFDAVHGFDVGDGGDPHAHAVRRGPVLLRVREIPTIGDRQDIDRALSLLTSEVREDPDATLCVDRVGVGSGVVSGLMQVELTVQPDPRQPPRKRKPKVVPVNNGERATDPDQYANVRAEDFWGLRQMFRKGEIAIAPLGDEEDRLMDELAAIQYEETRTGKIALEQKDKVRTRIGRSPNLGDGVAMAFRPTKTGGGVITVLT